VSTVSALISLTTDDLNQLAGALRSGRLTPPFSPLALRRYVPESAAAPVAAELQQLAQDGMPARYAAACIETLCRDRVQRPVAEDIIDLVWTGPEAPGIVNRDTGVVVREMFQRARDSVLVAGYAIYQGRVIFKELAERMDQSPGLDVQMYLDIQRRHDDCPSAPELVRKFAERFVRVEWPGRTLPKVYYYPRSLEADHANRASLHAKCVVVDNETAFVSSANFTEAAQSKNIEVGALIRSRPFARRLAEHFRTLSANHAVRAVDFQAIT
jgi:phosphatidylserine/phosphatidylglycerophosphate/cardiolipin synthase-like enzyme